MSIGGQLLGIVQKLGKDRLAEMLHLGNVPRRPTPVEADPCTLLGHRRKGLPGFEPLSCPVETGGKLSRSTPIKAASGVTLLAFATVAMEHQWADTTNG